MKAIKLVLIFVIVLGGVLGAFYLIGKERVDPSLPLSDTTYVSIGELKVENSSEPKQLKCEHCQEIFNTADEKNAHSCLQYECDVKYGNYSCTQAFSSQDSLAKHKKNDHHFECKVCGPDTWFTTSQQLDDHMKTKHQRGKNIKNLERQ